MSEQLLTPVELLGVDAIAVYRVLSSHKGNFVAAKVIVEKIEAGTSGALTLSTKRVYQAIAKLQRIGIPIEGFKGRSGGRPQGFCLTESIGEIHD